MVNTILQINNIEIAACMIDNTEDEFTVSFKFKSFNKPELMALIKELHSDIAVKEIVWSS